jgi:multicomponent Na+:H+ antiporter subunit G
MSDFIYIISAILTLIGSIFILLASIGILKLPDLYIRMSATTKAASLGVGTILLGTCFHYLEVGIIVRTLIIIIFIFLTAPIAAHVIGRAAYRKGIKMKKSIINEVEDKYNPENNTLF